MEFDARRVKIQVSVMLGVAWLVGMTPYYAWKLDWIGGAARDVFGLAALAIIFASAIFVFSKLHYGTGVKQVLAMGFFFLIVVQAGDAFGAWTMGDLFASPPNRPMIDRPMRQTMLVTGGFILLSGLYFALIEGEDLLRRMERERLRAMKNASDCLAAEREKESLEQLLEQRRNLAALGKMTGSIAHDFNNLLTAIMGHTELAGARGPLDEKAARHLSLAMQASNRARDLVQQILSFTKGGSAERVFIQPYAIANEVAALMATSLYAPVTLALELDAHSGKVLANPIELHKVILNLCTNAHYAMREKGGTLTLRVANFRAAEALITRCGSLPAGAYVCIEVRDTGPGIPEEHLPHIFEPFFTTKPDDAGTGMGLAIVHGIVGEYGGGIVIENAPGAGVCFRVMLPLAVEEGN